MQSEEEIATRDSIKMIDRWFKDDLKPMKCFYASLSMMISYLVTLERKGKLDVNVFLDECICNAKQIADETKKITDIKKLKKT